MESATKPSRQPSQVVGSGSTTHQAEPAGMTSGGGSGGGGGVDPRCIPHHHFELHPESRSAVSPESPTPGATSGATSPILARFKKSLAARGTMSKTWARKEYLQEIDISLPGPTGQGQGRSVERGQGGGGLRTAPLPLTQQDRTGVSRYPGNTVGATRPTSLYASPSAVAAFKPLPLTGTAPLPLTEMRGV